MRIEEREEYAQNREKKNKNERKEKIKKAINRLYFDIRPKYFYKLHRY